MMAATFNKILIPVDFSVNTEIALKKAIGLIEQDNAEIHLVHVAKPKAGIVAKFIIWEAEKKLAQWKTVIQETRTGIKVNAVILKGSSAQKMIIESAKMFSPDLIIIGKQDKTRRWPFSRSVSPDQIARKSNCPVLTAKQGSMHSLTKIIVLPVRDFVPERKMELAILIAKKCRAQVHLLAIRKNNKEKEGSTPLPFLKAYNQLRENLHHPVEYSLISRHNTARAVLEYAESVKADMILLNPETESAIPGLTGSRHISDFIRNNSKIQVLDVLPY
jgi:nucleotide-binding universal stress UspA family protein